MQPKGDCHNWTEKKECRFGDRCRFLHGSEDKRATYRPQRTESASGEQEICRQYEKRGKCRFGDKVRNPVPRPFPMLRTGALTLLRLFAVQAQAR